jgi:tetratricopeptide (TPR) repeat protein
MYFALPLLICVLSAAGQADPAALSRQGAEAMRSGRFDDAVKTYRELVRLVPGNAGLLINLGLALHSAGKHEEAGRQFEAALKLSPKDADAWYLLGMARLNLNEQKDAMAAFDRALAIQPSHEQARFELGSAYLSAGRPDRALKQFDLLPESSRKLFGLGRAHRDLAAQKFSALEKTAPDSAEFHALVAQARFDQQQYATALHLYREALKRDPKLPGVHAAIAEIYRRTGHPDWAEVESTKETGGHIRNDLYRDALEHLAKAADNFGKLAAMPATPEGVELLAESLWLQDRRMEAIEQLKKGPKTPRLARRLARYLWSNRNFKEARPIIEALLRRNPDDPELNYQLGEILLETAGPENALPHLEQAQSILPAQAALGRAYLALGRTQDAIPHLRAALGIDEDGQLHYALWRALAAAGQTQEAQLVRKQHEAILAKKKAREQETRGLEITPPQASQN